jgi:hypothetical protein
VLLESKQVRSLSPPTGFVREPQKEERVNEKVLGIVGYSVFFRADGSAD